MTNLVAFYNKITCLVDKKRTVDVTYLDLSKAVFHNILINKLMKYSLDKWTVSEVK